MDVPAPGFWTGTATLIVEPGRASDGITMETPWPAAVGTTCSEPGDQPGWTVTWRSSSCSWAAVASATSPLRTWTQTSAPLRDASISMPVSPLVWYAWPSTGVACEAAVWLQHDTLAAE